MSDAAMNKRNGKRERVEVKEARPRRGGATPAQIVKEAEILKQFVVARCCAAANGKRTF